MAEGESSVDLEKLLGKGVRFLSDYLAAFGRTLRHPSLRFQLQYGPAEEGAPGHVVLGSEGGSPRLSPALLGFVIVSIALGSTVNALIPGRTPGPDWKTTTVVTAGVWILCGVVLELLCLMAGGRGGIGATVTATLQVLAVMYVVSSFAGLLWGALLTVPTVSSHVTHLPELFAKWLRDPVSTYFAVQSALLAIYLPRAVQPVHELGRVRRAVLTFILIPVAALGYLHLRRAIYQATHIMLTMPIRRHMGRL